MNKPNLSKTQKDTIKKLNQSIQDEKDFISNMAAVIYSGIDNPEAAVDPEIAVDAAIKIRELTSHKVHALIAAQMQAPKQESPISQILGEGKNPDGSNYHGVSGGEEMQRPVSDKPFGMETK